MKIAEILDSEEAPNERNTATLRTALEQIETKRTTVMDLDTRILATIEDAEALETEILETEDVMYNLAEKITLIKVVLARPKPLNVQAPTFQPQAPPSASVVQPPTPANLSASKQSLSEDTPVTNAIQERPLTAATGASHLPQAQEYVNTSTSVSQNVSRLPKLTLPIFGGDPLKWQTFWDSFDSAVHSNNMLTNVQKLNYLRAHLEGEAARAIAGFPLTSVNYQQSLDVLRDRFGDQQRIINAHMHALMSLPNANNNITSLRTFHDVIENHVCGLSINRIVWSSTSSYDTRETSS